MNGQPLEDMRFIYTKQACNILIIDGRPVDRRTFLKLMKRYGISPAHKVPPNTPLWDEDKIIPLKKKLSRSKGFGAPIVEK